MSYTKLNNSIFEDDNLKHTEFRVLVYLIRNYNNKKGYSFPIRKQIIEACKINKDTLNNVLNSLEEKGYITRKNNPLRAGRNTIYYIHKHLINQEIQESKSEIVEDVIETPEETIVEMEEVECEDLKQKVETVESVVCKKINRSFKKILEKLSWDEIIKIDMQMIGKICNESYYLNAIYMLRPDLKTFV
ncbi:MAG: helix-turn-helix domain-containing protein [Paraclostridium sp.]